jgi:hypothetical protein
MNPRERLMLIRLVTRLVQQPEVVKDADAALDVEALLKARPDAPYLLMQRALMLEAALEDFQLHAEQNAATTGTSMLGERLFFQVLESLLHGHGNGYSSGATQMPLDMFETQSNVHAAQPPSRKVNTLFDASLGGVDDDLPDLDAGDGSWL